MKNRHRTPSAILTATAPMNTPPETFEYARPSITRPQRAANTARKTHMHVIQRSLHRHQLTKEYHWKTCTHLDKGEQAEGEFVL